jgi:hypothetical protein
VLRQHKGLPPSPSAQAFWMVTRPCTTSVKLVVLPLILGDVKL